MNWKVVLKSDVKIKKRLLLKQPLIILTNTCVRSVNICQNVTKKSPEIKQNLAKS